MKYFKYLLFLTVFTFIVSYSKDSNDAFDAETNLNVVAKSNYQLSSKDSISVMQNANLDMISFVDGISEFYNNGDTYADLKSQLDPV